MKLSYTKIACALTIAALTINAHADIRQNPAGIYLGGNLGIGMDGWNRWEGSDLQYPDWNSGTVNKVKHRFRFAYGANLGYSFNDKFAIQGEFRKMLGNKLTINGRSVDASLNDFAFVGQMSMPMGNIYLDAVLGLGLSYNNADSPINDHHQWMPVLGLGDHMMFSKHMSAGIAYRYFMSVAKYNRNNYTPSHQYLVANITYHFGDRDTGDTIASNDDSTDVTVAPSTSGSASTTKHDDGSLTIG